MEYVKPGPAVAAAVDQLLTAIKQEHPGDFDQVEPSQVVIFTARGGHLIGVLGRAVDLEALGAAVAQAERDQAGET